MDTTSIPASIRQQWIQPNVPIIVRTGVKGQKLTARLPYREDNRSWLHRLATGKRKPEVSWVANERAWKLPLSWLNRFVDGALGRYGQVYLVQPFQEFEKCAQACRNAKGHDCQCSCMGANHGVGDGTGWFDVSEAFSFRWGQKQAAIRLITKKI